MKNIGISFFIIVSTCLFACKEKAQDSEEKEDDLQVELIDEKPVQDEYKSLLRPKEKIELGKIYTDTITYLEFNDEGDERLFLVKKNKDTINLVYTLDKINQFIKGDEVAINWKMDSIRYAGDSEFLYFTEFLTSTKKIKSIQLTDKKVEFLWRETLFDKDLNTAISAIILNEDYIKTITEPEKAAIAYVATFVGNECEWDGNANESRSNLKCKILWALNLGYQCSYQHLDYLRFWFRSNETVLKAFETCPTIPDGATIQTTFDEINLEVNSGKIIVSFKATGVNVREGASWNWKETHFFDFKENELIVVKKEVSEIVHNTFQLQEN
jgi:hypothetical protein